MLRLTVWGVPRDGLVAEQGATEPGDLQVILGKCMEDLRSLVAGIPEFSTGKDDVYVFFPNDLLKKGLGEELLVEVFSDKLRYLPHSRHPNSPARVLDMIAESVRKNLAVHIPQCEEVVVSMFLPPPGQQDPLTMRRPHAQRDWSQLVKPS